MKVISSRFGIFDEGLIEVSALKYKNQFPGGVVGNSEKDQLEIT